MMQDNLNNQSYIKEEDSIDIKKEAGYYLFFWPYFLAGIVVAMVSAFLYLKTADRIYTSSAQLQIKKPAEDAASFLTGGMEFFGFDQVNVENDIAVLTSQHILSQVVTRLDLQTNIYKFLLEIYASLLFYCAPIPLVRKKRIVESLLPLPLLADVIYVNGPLTDLEAKIHAGWAMVITRVTHTQVYGSSPVTRKYLKLILSPGHMMGSDVFLEVNIH